MKFQFFNIYSQDSQAGQAELNLFCCQQRVTAVEKQFVADGSNSFWAICVTFLDGGVAGTVRLAQNKRERVDYKEVLSERDFSIYADLRALRKTLSEQEGIPAYALFTNEQLAEIVTRRVRTLQELSTIEGIGKSRLDKYGDAFLRLLQSTDAKQRDNEKTAN